MIATSPFIHARCPITGLSVRREPEWTDVPLAQGYTASFCVIGERILATAPSGNSGSTGVPRFFEFRERVLREAGLWERRYVEIKDFGGVARDHPRLGRVQVTRGMLAEHRRGKLRGFWGYNGPPAFRWIMKVAATLARVNDAPVDFVEDYTAAIRLATVTQADLLRRPSETAWAELERRDLDLDGLRYGFAVLEPGVLLIDVPPRLPLEHIDRFFDHQERLVSDPGLFPGGEFRVIVRLAPQQSASWRVRRAFLVRTNALRKRVPCRLCVLVGPRKRLGLVVILNQALATFGLVAAEDVPQALELARADLQRGVRRRLWPALLGRWPSGEQTWTRLELQARVDELLRAVGSINWESEGVDALSVERVGGDNPLKGVYEAIALIKQDFDSILRENEEMQAQVLRAAKLASLGTLTAGMAHELNNPLTAVLGFAQRLARSGDAETRSGAEVVVRASQRMKATVEKLLRTSKQEVARHGDRVDLNVAVREALQLFERQLQARGVRVQLDLAADLPVVRGDAGYLEGLVTNLVTNALDAFDEPSARGDDRSDLIQIRTTVEPGWIKLEVEDNGCGMPADVVERVFDPFFTTKDVGRGSGLGLYVSHMIAEEHSGNIALRSEPGRGTVVELTFPDLERSDASAMEGVGR
jgi:signal transduction histidine kinase